MEKEKGIFKKAGKYFLLIESSIKHILVILILISITLEVGALTTETKEEMIELFNSTSVLDNIETILNLQEGDDSKHISWEYQTQLMDC